MLGTFFLTAFALFIATVNSECPRDYRDVGGRCYLFVDTIHSDFLQAREICRNVNADLPILKDCHALGNLANYLLKHDPIHKDRSFWLGATNAVTGRDWRWLDGSPVQMGAPFWGRESNGTFEPSSTDGCMALYQPDGFYMHDVTCNVASGSPLCQKNIELDGTCNSPYVGIANSCFQFLPTLNEFWQDSQTICKSSGGSLAILDDCNLMTDIIRFIESNAGYGNVSWYWIGGYWNSSRELQWIDGSPVDLGVPFWGSTGNYGPLQPDNENGGENCLELWADGHYYFNDVSCSGAGGVSPICEVEPFPTTTVPTTTTVEPELSTEVQPELSTEVQP